MWFVGPRHTEYASTHGTMHATSTTQESASKKLRNQNAANVIAKSFEKSASAFRSAWCSRTASTAKATATMSSSISRAVQSGSTR
jgi:hypothetical protein